MLDTSHPGWPAHPFTTAEAYRNGVRPRDLIEAVAEQELIHVARGVYVRGDLELTTERRVAALSRVIGPTWILCDRTAAEVHGVDCRRYFEHDVVPGVEAFVLRGDDASHREEVAGGSRDLQPSDWMVIDGVRVTTPLRTAVDLACKLPARRGLGIVDALMRGHGFTVEQMQDLIVRRFRGRRGVRKARIIVSRADGRAESQPESWMRFELIEHGLPRPELNYSVMVDGVERYRLDLAYPHAMVAIEFDGEEFHTRPEDREYDAARRRWLRAHGWYVVVLTKEDLRPAATQRWITEVREALSRRG